jgi:hypothetical protein
MFRDRLAAFAIATFVITGVPAVPAFSQSASALLPADAAPSSDTDRTRTGVARLLYTGALSHSNIITVPPNLIVPRMFQSVVDSMLRGSPTFRRQCVRLANAPQMIVVLDWFQPQDTDRVRARTLISNAPDGRRYAAVAIRPVDDPVELIAHELEHVLEQLDEVNLPTLAAVPSSGVRRCDCQQETFETVRAVRAGRAASAEVRRNGT